jgi:hypothetical protein
MGLGVAARLFTGEKEEGGIKLHVLLGLALSCVEWLTTARGEVNAANNQGQVYLALT